MSDLTAPVGGTDDIVSVPVSTPADTDNTPITVTEGARQLAKFRWERDHPEEKKPEVPAAPEAAAAPELAETPTSDPATDPAVTTEEPEPALPTIEPPRSWTKEEKEEFATYPREAQERISRAATRYETEFRRSQNEAAEKLKGLTAKEQAAEQARQQYEQALPALLQTLQEQQQGEFADIKSMADVTKLANEDWPRYARWDAQQKQIAAVAQEAKATHERRQSEYKIQYAEYASKEDAKAADLVPELSDKEKTPKIANAIGVIFEKHGQSRKDVLAAWNGEVAMPVRSSAMQEIFAKAALYDLAKAAVQKPAPKPVPPVQRPGVSKPATSAADAEIQTLEKRFERDPSLKNAAALRLARQRAA